MNEKIFPYTSLYMVTEINENGVGNLKWLADLINGKFEIQLNKSAPPYQFLRAYLISFE